MLVETYALYVLISLAMTIWVGHTLHKNGRVFLVQNFQGNEPLADSINHLLLVGFYLINFGFISLALRYGTKPEDYGAMIEFLSTKIGLVIIILGLMHFTNMIVLVRFRNFRIAHDEAKAMA